MAILLVMATNLFSQERELKIKKIKAKITVDGIIDEAIWNEIIPLNITQKVPNAGAQPTQKTEIRIAYDAEYLYLSGRMFDDEPEKINANSKKRDDFTENSEWCGLLIDSYNDRENALVFFVTPNGSKLDMALSNDIVGPNAFNVSWNTYWDAASTRNELGWFAEIRIPFSSLPFEVDHGKVIMGITTWRYYARNDETDIFPPRDLSTGSSFRPSLTQRFIFEGIKKRNLVHITPYVLSGFESVNRLSEGLQKYEGEKDFRNEVGADVKVALGSNATLDLTVNTDFAQVEVDDQQVNLTRSNLFFPEKRLFFQERASLFNFDFGTSDKLFHSRRIGIVDGKQTRIYGGARIIGKLGKWEGGALTMQTASQGLLNSENFSVLRLRKKIFNENSTIGTIFTHRTDLNGNYNSVYGIDANVRIVKENYLSLRWAQSFTDQEQHKIGALNSVKYFMEISKRSQQGFTYTVNYSRAGKEYDPGIGFERRENFSQLNYTLAYNVFPGQESKVVQYGPYFSGSHTWENLSKELESRNQKLGFQLFTKLGWTYDLSFNLDRERLASLLILPNNSQLSAGDYSFNSVNGTMTSPLAKKLSYSITLGTGNFYNGKKTTFSIAPFINITPDFSLEGIYEYNRLKFPSENKPKHIQLTSVKALYTFSTKLTITTIIQHNSISKIFLGSFRLRYNPKEGNDFYLVYNGDVNQDRERSMPMLPLNNTQTIFLKYSHTFHL